MNELSVRRVVLAVSTERDLRAAKRALDIANALGAGVEALFVEDADAFAWAGHPLPRRIGARGAQPFALAELEHEWRAAAKAIERAVAREAAELGVELRFTVARGRPQDLLQALLADGDVVVVARPERSSAREPAPGVRVLFDGSPAAERALEAAIRVAGPSGELEAWVSDAACAERVQRAALGRVAGAHLRVTGALEDADLRAALEMRGGVVLVAADHALADRVVRLQVGFRLPAAVVLVH